MNFDSPAFAAWALCAAFLFLKMYANTIVQFRAKMSGRLASLPEDARAFKPLRDGKPEESSELYMRAAGCWENDLENIPMFLILALAYVGLGGSYECSVAYFVIFSIARTVHTITYLKALQPHRAIAYTIGALVCAALVVGIFWRVSRAGLPA